MRLSEWRKNAPLAEAASNQVMAAVLPVLVDLGAKADAECWVIWGEDPGMKYSLLAPALAGLITVAIRPLGSEEGPRATGKLTRWSKLNISELAVEASGGHRIVAVQIESYVLKGIDDEADRICEFVRGLVAGIENRIPQQVIAPVAVTGPAVAAAVAAGVAGGPAHAAATRVSTPKSARGSGLSTSRAGSRPEPAASPADGARAARRITAKVPSRPAGPAPDALPLAAASASIPEPSDVAPAAVAAVAAELAAAPVAGEPVAAAPAPVASAAVAPGPVPVPLSPAPSVPVAAGSAAYSPADSAPRPISSRTHQGADVDRPQPPREEWISPHPIAVPHQRQKAKPRRWAP
jgi:hypothetical protein